MYARNGMVVCVVISPRTQGTTTNVVLNKGAKMRTECVIKPPLGIMPKKVWIRNRIEDLSHAILRNIESGTADKTMLLVWSEEIFEHCANLKKMEEKDKTNLFSSLTSIAQSN